LHAPEGRKLAVSNLSKDRAMKLYVGNLSFNTSEAQLEQLFASVGSVASVNVMRDRSTGQSRGFGFVEMADAGAGAEACSTLNDRELDGRRLKVNEARPMEPRSGGFRPSRGRDTRW
jgi:RNA recognition motif-containing protein